MAYTGTYRAFIKYIDGTKTEWTGLRKTQAKWRFHWIDRTLARGAAYKDKPFDEFGWEREWAA